MPRSPTGLSKGASRKTSGSSLARKTGRRSGGRPPVVPPPARLGRLAGEMGYLLRRAGVVFSVHWSLQFAGEGAPLTPVQCGMLILVDENPGLTQIELARLLRVEGSTLWQLVDRLLELGLVRRRRVPKDRRAYAIHLSQAGRQALRRYERGSRLHKRELLECLSDKERLVLANLLTRVIEAGERLNESKVSIMRGVDKRR